MAYDPISAGALSNCWDRGQWIHCHHDWRARSQSRRQVATRCKSYKSGKTTNRDTIGPVDCLALFTCLSMLLVRNGHKFLLIYSQRTSVRVAKGPRNYQRQLQKHQSDPFAQKLCCFACLLPPKPLNGPLDGPCPQPNFTMTGVPGRSSSSPPLRPVPRQLYRRREWRRAARRQEVGGSAAVR
jgi:hypothetical protein